MNVTLDRVEDIAHNIKTFWFVPEQPVRYEAGQFIELTIRHDTPDERGVRRWFTLSSSPTDTLVSITTKVAQTPSTYKKHLFALRPGDSAYMSDTMGDFVLPKDIHAPLIFIAGGIGVTPVHSMAKYLYDSGQNRTTHLLYAAHNSDEIAFQDLFNRALTRADYITDNKPTTQNVLELVSQYDNPYIYLSGPEEMVEIMFAELKESGIASSRLITDYFPGYAGEI